MKHFFNPLTWILRFSFCQGFGSASLFTSGEEFTFTGESGVRTVKEGERNVVLDCSVTNPQDVIFEWILDGVLVQNETRRHQEGPHLLFSRALKDYDSGSFLCIARNTSSGFSATSESTQLHFLWISSTTSVRLALPTNPNEIKEGQEVILECKVDGSLEIRFIWYKNGKKLDTRDGHLISRGKKLHIPNVSVDDNGSYSCLATSDAGVAQSKHKFDLIVKNESIPQIQVSPQNVIVRRNLAVQFDCIYDKNPPVEWIFNQNEPIQNSSRYTVLGNGSLIIDGVNEPEVGIYKCLTHRISNSTKKAQVYAAALQLSSLEELKLESLLPVPFHKSRLLGFPLNSTVEIFCEKPIGLPEPQITWEGPGGKNIQKLTRDQDTLVLRHLKQNEAGNYTCKAENSHGQTAITFTLKITQKPRILEDPFGVSGEEGERVWFECKFIGSSFPLSRVSWLQNNHTLKHTHSHHNHTPRIRNIEQNSTLVISTLQAGDAGDYACQITTEGYLPITSRLATLSVREKLKFVSIPVDRRLEMGSSYRIPCKAAGTPPPTLKWSKVGESESHWPYHITDENGVLNFQRIQKNDQGEYACVARNIQGQIHTTVQIHVFASPRFIVRPKNPTEAVEGEKVRMDCEAEGDPAPTIKWDRNTDTQAIDTHRYLVLDNGSLVILEVSQEDNEDRFGCTAGNSGGFKREEVTLIVRRKDEFVSVDNSVVMSRSVWITLSVATGYMLLVIGLMLWCRYRQIKRKHQYLADIRRESGETELKDGVVVINENGTLLPKNELIAVESCRESIKSDGETGKSTHSSGIGGGKVASATASVGSQRSQNTNQSKRSTCTNYDEISFPRKDLQFIMLLGHGNFGEVFLAKGKIEKKSEEKVVMVKALQTKEEGTLFEFKREVDIFYKLDHENVAALLGLCREMDPHYMVMEYSDWGDLKQFLLATRKEHPRTPKPHPLSTNQIIHVVRQVALGMDHLANQRFVHKDLAARNCLISTGFRIQISNPRLSKDTYANEYFHYRNKVVPLRWLSPEALLEDDYSTKSDVWAFGVVLWEVSHQAALPLAQFTDEALVERISKQETLWKTDEGMTETLRSLAFKVWDTCPRNRPTFTEILLALPETNRGS